MKAARFVPYDTQRYPFAELIAKEVYHVPDLSRLHVYYREQLRRKGELRDFHYGDNLVLRQLMDQMPENAPFYKLYHDFAHAVLAPMFGGLITYTAHPKFRVHLAGTESVSKWHIDADYTHRPEQINAWLPFTNSFDTNTIWVESDYGKGDHTPVNVMYGEVLLFDGGYLSHGTVPNTTDTTRVSIDFRFHARKQHLPSPDLGILSYRPSKTEGHE